jgi:hypothetical protein
VQAKAADDAEPHGVAAAAESKKKPTIPPPTAKAGASSNGATAAKPAPAAPNGNGKASAPAQRSDHGMVLGAIAVLVALVVGAMLYPPSERKVVFKLSPQAFRDRGLRSSQDSALVIFTQSNKADCFECGALKKSLRTPQFKSALQPWPWQTKGVPRIGEVYCDKYAELCERFGVTGSEGDEPGLPYIVWFKRDEALLKENGEYDGEKSGEGIIKWVSDKRAANML